MFEILITYLKSILTASRLAEVVEYAVIKKTEVQGSTVKQTAPMIVKGEGQFANVDFGNYRGLIYIRKNGNISSSDEPAKGKACKRTYHYSIPIRIVCGHFEENDCFGADRLAEQIIAVVSGKNRTLKDSLMASAVNVKLVSYSTDPEKIEKEEYSDYVDFNYSLVYVAIDLRVEIDSPHNLSCFVCPDPVVVPPEPDPVCLIDIDFSDQSAAEALGWITGEWSFGGGQICADNLTSGCGFIYGDYQDNVAYNVVVEVSAIDNNLSLLIFGTPEIVITAPGVYEYTRTGTTGDNLVIIANDGAAPGGTCITSFKICEP